MAIDPVRLAMRRWFNRPSRARSPQFIRFIASPHVDRFFGDGSLRLSSFEVFRRHPDENRRDEQEGRIVTQIHSPLGQMNVLATMAQETYIMCTSMFAPDSSLLSQGTGILLRDPLRFADAVARSIRGFVGGVDGRCEYNDATLQSQNSQGFAPPAEGEDPEKWMRDNNRRMFEHVIPVFFRKAIRFEHEQEYRFVWFARGKYQPYIDIKCPAAWEFCERLPLTS